MENDFAESQAQAIAKLPQDLALMKMENDNIVALAAARPRDHHKIKADLLAQIEAYPSFAKSAIYCKPVGKDAQGRMQYARGLSVRAAEAIVEAYGYCRVRVDVLPVDADTVKIEASFIDYQKGRIWQDGGILSKFYRSRNGQMVRHAEDRFYGLVVKAEASRRVREVILRSVPPGLRSELMELAEKKINELLDDKMIEKIIAYFANKKVTLEMLEEHLGRTVQAGWTKQDQQDLWGLWNALKDEQITVEEVFGKDKQEKQPQQNVKASDLTSPKESTNGKGPKAGEGEPATAMGTACASAPPSPDTDPALLASDLDGRLAEAKDMKAVLEVMGQIESHREGLGSYYQTLRDAAKKAEVAMGLAGRGRSRQERLGAI